MELLVKIKYGTEKALAKFMNYNTGTLYLSRKRDIKMWYNKS